MAGAEDGSYVVVWQSQTTYNSGDGSGWRVEVANCMSAAAAGTAAAAIYRYDAARTAGPPTGIPARGPYPADRRQPVCLRRQ